MSVAGQLREVRLHRSERPEIGGNLVQAQLTRMGGKGRRSKRGRGGGGQELAAVHVGHSRVSALDPNIGGAAAGRQSQAITSAVFGDNRGRVSGQGPEHP